MSITYRDQFKIIVYKKNEEGDKIAIGAITSHPTEEKYRFKRHGGGNNKGKWHATIDDVKAELEARNKGEE